MDIENLLGSGDNVRYYQPDFRNVLEDHLTYLRNHPKTVKRMIIPHETIEWRFDLYGFLRSQGVPLHLHWLIMRMSGMIASTDFDETKTELLLPDTGILSQILTNHISGNRIT